MKKIITLFLCLFGFFAANAQENPVTWSATYKAISATEGEIIINAKIDKNWHIYSQTASSAGPVPTSFNFEPVKNFKLLGTPTEIGAHEIFDKTFDAQISSFSDKAEFRQKIKITGKPGFMIPFTVEYMSCNDMMCLPPKTVNLNVKTQ
ncbi:MAG: protein-disulfide reductase DsbD domain-containing protein [Bacteroidota bacterium]